MSLTIDEAKAINFNEAGYPDSVLPPGWRWATWEDVELEGSSGSFASLKTGTQTGIVIAGKFNRDIGGGRSHWHYPDNRNSLAIFDPHRQPKRPSRWPHWDSLCNNASSSSPS